MIKCTLTRKIKVTWKKQNLLKYFLDPPCLLNALMYRSRRETTIPSHETSLPRQDVGPQTIRRQVWQPLDSSNINYLAWLTPASRSWKDQPKSFTLLERRFIWESSDCLQPDKAPRKQISFKIFSCWTVLYSSYLGSNRLSNYYVR